MAKKQNNTAIIALALVGVIAVIGLLTLRVPVSGAAASQGQVNVTISTLVSITMIDNIVDFGTGYVNSGDAFAIIDSNVSSAGTNWTNTSNGADGWPGNADYLEVENNGNTEANVTIKASSAASTFIGGTSPAQYYASMNNEAGSCGTIQGTYAALTIAETDVCNNFNFADSADSFNVTFELQIPSDATTGTKSNTITFTASQA